MLRIPKLQVPNPLPRARIQPPIGNRNRDTRTDQRALHMRRHIIAALGIVPVQALALLVFRHDAVQRRGHVRAHVLVVVLVQTQRARGVLDEEVEEARLVVFQLGELFEDCVGDEIGAPAAGGEGELFLEPVGNKKWLA